MDDRAPDGGASLQHVARLNMAFVRPEKQGWLSEALDWGLPRCHTSAARSLFSALATLLGEFNATILPVEHAAGDHPAVDFRVTLSCSKPDGRVCRIRFAVTSQDFASGGNPDEEAPRRDHPILVNIEECEQTPWEVAGRLVGEMLERAAASR